MTLLQVLEHEWLPIRSGGGQSLNVHQAALLERLADSLPAHALEWRRAAVKFTQFCGVIQLGDLTIEVLPRSPAKSGMCCVANRYWCGCCR